MSLAAPLPRRSRDELPPELRRWNWGAFLLNWIWGIGNDTPIALLMFVPVVQLAMPFVLGAKGNAWAWENGRWRDLQHFSRVQRSWAKWGFAVTGLAIVLFVGLFAAVFALVFSVFAHSDAYRLGVRTLQQDAAVAAALGSPVSAGMPFGSINTDGGGGSADLTFSATGPRGGGSVHLRATKEFGDWRLTSERLKLGARILELVPGATGDTPKDRALGGSIRKDGN